MGFDRKIRPHLKNKFPIAISIILLVSRGNYLYKSN